MGKAQGPYFGDFGSLLGSLLETILDTFRVPFLHRFSKDFGGSPEVNIHLGVGAIWWVAGVLIASITLANQLVC